MEFREQLTIGVLFFFMAYGALLGLLQIVAARHRRADIAPWAARNPVRGAALGAALILLSYAWFFGTHQYEIFSPGPASSEFAFFFTLAFWCALASARVASRLWTRRGGSP